MYLFQIAGRNDTIRIQDNHDLSFRITYPLIASQARAWILYIEIANPQAVILGIDYGLTRYRRTVVHYDNLKMYICLPGKTV